MSTQEQPEPADTPDAPHPDQTDPETPDAPDQPAPETQPETQPETPPETTPNVETPDAPSPETQPDAPADQPPPPSTEAQMKAFDKAQRRAETYVRGIMDTLGDAAADFAGCPRCADFLPGFVLPHAIKPVTPEQRVAVKVSMGEDAEPQYVLDRDATTCPRCQGWGKVLTGSHVRNQDKATCPGCSGRGFTGPLATTGTLPQPDAVAATVGANGADETPAPETDPWGRLKGDPNYGVLPGYTS